MAQPTSSSSYSRASVDPDRIRLYAETCGTSNVTSDAYTVMSEELTNILRKIVGSARNYAVHGRRTRLDVEDVRRACEDMRIQPPLGYVAPCVATMRHIPNNAGEDFFVREYPEYDIQSLLASPQRPLPLKMHLRMHWLAFEGVVQAVPENIIPIKEEVEDEQEDLLSGRPSRIQVRRDTAAQPLQGNASTSYRVAARSVVQQEHVTVKPIHPATLSMERQAYVKNVIEACVGPADQSRIYALQSLEMDTGLQEALPTLALIIKNGWYVEKGCFYQAAESDGKSKRTWKWCSEMKSYDDKYVLSAQYSKDQRSAQGYISKSVSAYINEDGEIVKPLLQKEIEALYEKLLKGEN